MATKKQEEPQGASEGESVVVDLAPLSVEQVLAQIADAQRNQDSAVALQEIANSLGRLTEVDRQQLLATPAVAKLVEDYKDKVEREGAPGTVVVDAKGRVISRVEPTWESMCASDPPIEWLPLQTRWITVNGVQIWVQAGVPMNSPSVFKAIAEEAWKAEQSQVETAKMILYRNLGPNTMIMTGSGEEIWRGSN